MIDQTKELYVYYKIPVPCNDGATSFIVGEITAEKFHGDFHGALHEPVIEEIPEPVSFDGDLSEVTHTELLRRLMSLHTAFKAATTFTKVLDTEGIAGLLKITAQLEQEKNSRN